MSNCVDLAHFVFAHQPQSFTLYDQPIARNTHRQLTESRSQLDYDGRSKPGHKLHSPEVSTCGRRRRPACSWYCCGWSCQGGYWDHRRKCRGLPDHQCCGWCRSEQWPSSLQTGGYAPSWPWRGYHWRCRYGRGWRGCLHKHLVLEQPITVLAHVVHCCLNDRRVTPVIQRVHKGKRNGRVLLPPKHDFPMDRRVDTTAEPCHRVREPKVREPLLHSPPNGPGRHTAGLTRSSELNKLGCSWWCGHSGKRVGGGWPPWYGRPHVETDHPGVGALRKQHAPPYSPRRARITRVAMMTFCHLSVSTKSLDL